MNANIELRQSLTERLAQIMLEGLTKGRNLDRIDYLKCKLGLETFLINLSKLSVVYGLAAVVGLVWQVFIFHLAYMSIRTYAYGVHSESSLHCTIISCIILIGFPTVLLTVQLPRISFVIISVVSHFTLKKYAPAATKKNGIVHLNEERKQKLRHKALMSNFIILIVALIIPSLFIGNLLIIGNILASLMTTPVAYKLLKNEWRD
ncbi:MAG: accessory gene regulator AgrB [Defluviitaleaceae bacterium]|nr:accessory gene regulator AgrB [Defluviitaleaceae bacterium]